MSGVPVPVYPIVRPFGNDAIPPTDAGGATLPIPVDSQIGILVGAASFEDGFPAATMTDPEAGGIPPFGQDVNGLLLMITAYCALVQAGQLAAYNEDASDAWTGYAIGARLASITTPGRVWVNLVDANENDPDVDATGWYAQGETLFATVALSGAVNNYALPGASDFAIDFDTTGGALDFSGFISQRDGQRLYLSNIGANLLQVLALSGLSTAPRQVRNATDLALVQNQTLTLQYFAGAPGGGKWLLV
jgi:hypothetical protein